MRANEIVAQPTKKPYVKPELVTHGSVQQLTECRPVVPSKDCGSNLHAPSGGEWGFRGW